MHRAGSSSRNGETADAPDAVRLVGVTKRYDDRSPRPAVDAVDLRLPRGSYTAVMGPSGCGKTTLLNLVGALDTPTAGRVRVAGVDVESASDARRTALRRESIGFVFQRFNLHPKLTALENVALPLSFASVPRREARRRAEDRLATVGLTDLAAHSPNELSGGEQQRVAIARAMIGDPAVVVADEPTGNLDRETGESVMALFDEVVARGHTLLVTTHDPVVAEHAERVLRMVDGRIAGDSAVGWSAEGVPAR